MNKSAKLREAIEDYEQNKKSKAQDILGRIRARQDPDYEKKRKTSEKFVEQFRKKNGPITYFSDQWMGTKVAEDYYDRGYQQGAWESEERHKDVIYNMVMKIYT